MKLAAQCMIPKYECWLPTC